MPAVELFSIACETCGSRLKVQSASAIGQIHPCPRCESMVHIVPPPGFSLAASSAAAGQPGQDPTGSPHGESGSTQEFAASLPPLPPAIPSAPAGVAPPVVDHGWTSPAEAMGRKVALWGAAAALALCAVTLLIVWMTSSDDASNDVSAQAPAEPPAEAAPVEPGPSSTQLVDASVAEPLPSEPTEPVAEPSKSDPPVDPVEPPSDDPDAPPADPAEDPEPVEDPPDDEPAEPEPPSEPVHIPAEATPTPVVEIDDEGDEAQPPIDVAARLAERLPSVEITAAPLSRFVQMATSLTTIPITLDLNALAAAGVSVDARVSFAGANASTAEILTAVLAPLRLTYVTEENQLLITAPAAADRRLRTYTYPVDDLVETDAAGLGALTGVLQKMVAPESWQAARGEGRIEPVDGQLRITQTPALHYDLVEFCEKLRVARGLPIRSKYPASRFALDRAGQQADPLLAREITFTFPTPTRLSDVQRVLGKLSGATILVDWRALAAVELEPRSRITCAAQKKPLGEALTSVLGPIQLAWRSVAPGVLEITSRAQADRVYERKFYDVRNLLQAGVESDRLTSGVRQITASDAWSAGGGPGFLFVDSASGRLVVRQTADVHRQIARLLAALEQKVAATQ
jgi:hypothetical protein